MCTPRWSAKAWRSPGSLELLKAPARRVLCLPGARQLGTEAYRLLAQRAAKELMRIEGMRAVLLTGSLSRGDFQPGKSDVDLMLVAELPTLQDELAFRRELHAFQVRHNQQLMIFPHLDYAELRDMPLIFAFGDAWARAPAKRWQLLASSAPLRLPEPVALDPAEYLSLSLRRWVSHCRLLMEQPSRIEVGQLRPPLRFLCATVSTWLQLGTHVDPPQALEALRGRVEPGSVLGRLARDPTATLRRRDDAAYDELTLGALQALEAHCCEVAGGFDGQWPRTQPAPPVDFRPSVALGAAIEEGLLAGAAMVLPAPGADRHLLVLSLPEGLPVERGLRRGLGLAARISIERPPGGGPRPNPLLLTAPMLRAAGLVEPAPLLGASLAAGASWRAGTVEPPPAPPAPVMARAVEYGLARMLWRPRGRTFRVDRPARYGLRKMAAEVLGLYPCLRALHDGRPLDLALSTDEGDEAQLLGLYREQLDQVRSLLASRTPPWSSRT